MDEMTRHVQVKAQDADLGTNGRVRYMLHTGEDPDVSQLFAVDEDTGHITVQSSLMFAGQSTRMVHYYPLFSDHLFEKSFIIYKTVEWN